MLRAARRPTGSVPGQDRGRPTIPSPVLRRRASQDRSWTEPSIEGDAVEERVGEVLPIARERERSTWLRCRHVDQVNTCVSRCVLLCGTALVPRCMNV